MANLVKVLEAAHDVTQFNCGTPALNVWLQTIARQHQRYGISRTFVLIDEAASGEVIGYYALSIRAMTQKEKIPPALMKRLPANVPGLTLARLAVAQRHQNRSFGELLLVSAMKRAKAVAEQVGGYALFVDAKDAQAATFYEKYGFTVLPDDPLTMLIPLANIPS